MADDLPFGYPSDIGSLMPEAYGAGAPVRDLMAKLPMDALKSLFATVAGPGQLMQPNPYPAGSEQASWFEDQRQKGAVDWGRDAAFNLAGIGAPVAEAGALGAAGGKLKIPSPDEALLALHNTRLDRLQKADQLGGFAVPSTAIAKPAQGFNSFGDISLIADPSFVKPGARNPVFASDVYSPRFPSLNDEGTKIFKGFDDNGNRRYSALTLNNVVKEMRGNVRGGEGGLGHYGAGGVRSAVTPQFGALKDIQAARGRIITPEEFAPMKEETNKELAALADEFHPYSKYSGGSWTHASDFADMLGEYGPYRLDRMSEHYNNLPPELLDRARGFLDKLRDMPTEYFEAKPQRAVGIGEFKGAIVPHADMAAAAPILEKHGIADVVGYPGVNDPEARRAALQRFSKYFFAAPVGALATGAAINGLDEGR